jgi:hypothetical protein
MVKAQMPLRQVQQVFIVGHYQASHSYFTCQNEFRDTFPDSVPNRWTVFHVVIILPAMDRFARLH